MPPVGPAIAGMVFTLVLIAGLLLLAKWMSRLQEKPVSRTREWLSENRVMLESLAPGEERALNTRWRLCFQLPALAFALGMMAMHHFRLREAVESFEIIDLALGSSMFAGVAVLNFLRFRHTRNRLVDVQFFPPEGWLERRRPFCLVVGTLALIGVSIPLSRGSACLMYWPLAVGLAAWVTSETLLPSGPRVCEDGLYTGWRFFNWEAITWFRWLDNREAIVFGNGGKSTSQPYEILPVPPEYADQLGEYFEEKLSGKRQDDIPLTK